MELLRCSFIGVALLAGCGGGGGTSSTNNHPWALVAQSQPTALLSVSGTSATDVWVVGGDPRDGTGPVVEHYNGTAWTKLDAGVRNVDFWWVHAFDDGSVFMTGTNGTIVRYQNGAFTTMSTPGTAVVFGLWGNSSSDVWAVGGNSGGGAGAFAWRSDGTSWTNDTDVPSDLVTGGTIWKVDGISANDLWMSATNGMTLHWDGTTLTETPIPAAQQEQSSLTSIAGNSKRFVTAGGAFEGVVYENTGTGWGASQVPAGGMLLTGVTLSEDDSDGYAVGQFGTIMRRGANGWADDHDAVTQANLHAVWIDPSGNGWAVGGEFDTIPTKQGVLIFKGATPPPSF